MQRKRWPFSDNGHPIRHLSMLVHEPGRGRGCVKSLHVDPGDSGSLSRSRCRRGQGWLRWPSPSLLCPRQLALLRSRHRSGLNGLSPENPGRFTRLRTRRQPGDRRDLDRRHATLDDNGFHGANVAAGNRPASRPSSKPGLTMSTIRPSATTHTRLDSQPQPARIAVDHSLYGPPLTVSRTPR